MPTIVFTLVALIGATIHVLRHRDVRRPSFAVDTFLVWWLVVVIGVGTIVGALFHLFDGAQVASDIGYTRGNGGFQFENAMGDLSIGVAAVLCARFRGLFWLAVLIVMAIQFYGDAGGHIYFWAAENNTKPYNIGVPLYSDLILPTVGLILYAVSWRRAGDARPKTARLQQA